MSIEYRGKGNYRFRMRKDGIEYKENLFCSKKITEEDIEKKNWPKEVNTAHNKFELNVLEGRIGAGENMKFFELAQLVMDEYIKPNKGKNTISTYRNSYNNHLLEEFGNMQIGKIKKLNVVKFKNKKLKTLSPASVRIIISNLSTTFSQAIEWGLITTNPCEKNNVKPKKKNLSELFSAKEISALINNIYKEPDVYKTIFLTAAGMGYRQGEVLGLTIPDFDFNNNTIDLSKQRLRFFDGIETKYEEAPPKTPNSERKSYMPSFVKEVILEYIHKMKVTDVEQHLFINPNKGTVYTHGAVYLRFKKLLKATGLDHEKYTFHDLRHLQAVLLVSSGADLTSIASRMGDTVEVIANTYLHTLDEAEKISINKLENFVNNIKAN